MEILYLLAGVLIGGYALQRFTKLEHRSKMNSFSIQQQGHAIEQHEAWIAASHDKVHSEQPELPFQSLNNTPDPDGREAGSNYL